MTSLSFVNSLVTVFVPIGVFGATLALVCTVIAGAALARGAVGLCGGAVGIWIVGTMLSIAASFANEWMPTLVAGAALGVTLILGAALRALFGVSADVTRSAGRFHRAARRPTGSQSLARSDAP